MSMKLQVNTAGAWEDVLIFEAKDEKEMRQIGSRQAYLSGGRSKFRIADASNAPLAYCDPPMFEWRETGHKQQ